jgi:hypothetical protein
MRIAFSLLVTSLTFGSLVFSCQAGVNGLSNVLASKSDLPQTIMAKRKPSPGKPKDSAPHRGSGRDDRSRPNFIENSPVTSLTM